MAKKSKQASSEPRGVRAQAIDRLNRIEVGGAYIGKAGGAVQDQDASVSRQVKEYVAGVTRWRRWLDYQIGHHYRGDYGRMEPTLKQILRLAVYDLQYLHTPVHAAVHEAVRLAKSEVRTGAGGLVNGLLRSLLRKGVPEPEGAAAEQLGIRWSHPTWMVERFLHQFGQEATHTLLQINNERPVYGIRVNTQKVDRDAILERLAAIGATASPSPLLEDFIRVPRLQPVLRSGLLQEGAGMVQDEGAGMVVRVLDPQPGEVVYDICAAPGGKALYAASRMQNRGTLFAWDVHQGRLSQLSRAANLQGLSIIRTHVADFTTAELPSAAADRILIDAPCSGVGVLAKRADLRWQRGQRDLGALTALQDELLEAAAHALKPGGCLVYSTCSIDHVENQERVEAFLGRHRNFTLESAKGWVPDALVNPSGYYEALPHVHRIDGAFGARLRKAGT